MKRELLTSAQAAEYTSLALATLRKMAYERKIRTFKVLNCVRFLKEDLDALIVERPAELTKQQHRKRAAIQVDFGCCPRRL